jgi:hypothetical protein
MTNDQPLPAAPPGAFAEPMTLPPIALHPQPARSNAPPPAKPKEPEQKDSYRELIETVVFVVVLVLMLKTFLAEAFVIPTGSMADTLMGYHHKVACGQCGYPNLVNASDEVEPQDGRKRFVTKCQCQNCGFWNVLQPHGQGGGR